MPTLQAFGSNCRACGSTAQSCLEKINSASARCCSSCNGHVPASEAVATQDSESSEVGGHA